MRLIDIDAFRKENRMAEHCEDCERNSRECQYNDFSMMDFCGWLDDAPTVDAAPVVHGRWIKGGYACGENEYKCSACGETEWRTGCARMKYCMCCGAKMDLEEQGAKEEN